VNATNQTLMREREKALAFAVRPVAGELRLIDAADLIASIWAQKYANIQDLVNSSAELYSRPAP
jgi:hypothetical protein